jgi:hypothetical protein
LFVQSTFGLTCTSYLEAPGTGRHRRITSLSGVVVLLAGLTSVGAGTLDAIAGLAEVTAPPVRAATDMAINVIRRSSATM